MALEVNPKNRNARIAELQLLALKAAENDPDGEGWRNRLKDACLEYLLIFRNKACAFDDMRPFMDSMDYLSLDELIPKFRIETGLDDLSSNVDVQSAALSAQLCHLRDHAVRDGTDESPRAGSNQSFHIISQQLNHARRETVGPGRESGAIDQLVLILAVEMMESMEKHNLPSTNLQPSRILRQLRAAAILQYTLEQSPLSHDVRLPIVLLYRNLGAVSLQLSAFSQLSVKHVQWDTIGHLAFERISTIHPWPLSPSTRGKMEPDQYDPIRIVETVQDFYRMTQEKLPSKYKTAIEEGSYDQVVGFQEFEHRVESSLCRLSSHHEELAVSRIRKEVPASGGAINASSADDNDEGTMSPITRHGDICDNRDDSVYPIWSQHGTHNLGSMWRPRAGNGESVPMIDVRYYNGPMHYSANLRRLHL